jgi:hypothetical protein
MRRPSTYEGMMIALPPREWERFRMASEVEFAEFLEAAAGLAGLAEYPLSQRGPKKPRIKQASGKRNHHLSVRGRKETAPAIVLSIYATEHQDGEDRKDGEAKRTNLV